VARKVFGKSGAETGKAWEGKGDKNKRPKTMIAKKETNQCLRVHFPEVKGRKTECPK